MRPDGRAEQKALRPDVARQPDQVADALGAEHRVINVKRNHLHAVGGVSRARRDERRHRAGLGDAFLQNLPVLRLVVIEQRLAVHRLVKLALGRVNADLAKQRIHAERARLIGNDRHDAFANFGVAQQHAEQSHKCHGGGDFHGAGALEQLGKRTPASALRASPRATSRAGQESAQRLAALQQILRLRAVRRRAVKRRLGDVLVADRDVEALAELAQFLLVHLLLLVRNVAAFARFAQAVALDRLGQNHRRLALVLHRGLVGRIDLLRIMAAAQQLAESARR